MTVSIIGSGNLAWHLIQVCEEHSIQVAELYARNPKKARDLSGYAYDIRIQSSLDFRQSRSDIFILAVSDDAIAGVASEILLPDRVILVHTSGSRSMSALLPVLEKNRETRVGVIYPLMTFSKGVRLNFSQVPICVEAEDELTEKVLWKLSAKLSKSVHRVSSHQRSILHVAAVFGCNFVNHLLALSKEIMEDEGLDFELLKPLLNETFRKAMVADHPAEVQTGPAVRDDESTIARHKLLIKEDADLLNVYRTMTQSIQDWHQ